MVTSQRVGGGGGERHSLIWAIWGHATGQGMVFGLTVLNRVYNLTCLCPKEGWNLSQTVKLPYPTACFPWQTGCHYGFQIKKDFLI